MYQQLMMQQAPSEEQCEQQSHVVAAVVAVHSHHLCQRQQRGGEQRLRHLQSSLKVAETAQQLAILAQQLVTSQHLHVVHKQSVTICLFGLLEI
jgi:hypothetical protein